MLISGQAEDHYKAVRGAGADPDPGFQIKLNLLLSPTVPNSDEVTALPTDLCKRLIRVTSATQSRVIFLLHF